MRGTDYRVAGRQVRSARDERGSPDTPARPPAGRACKEVANPDRAPFQPLRAADGRGPARRLRIPLEFRERRGERAAVASPRAVPELLCIGSGALSILPACFEALWPSGRRASHCATIAARRRVSALLRRTIP